MAPDFQSTTRTDFQATSPTDFQSATLTDFQSTRLQRQMKGPKLLGQKAMGVKVPAFIKRTGSGVRSDQGAVDTPISSPLNSPRCVCGRETDRECVCERERASERE